MLAEQHAIAASPALAAQRAELGAVLAPSASV
jgi:hypothetical protein